MRLGWAKLVKWVFIRLNPLPAWRWAIEHHRGDNAAPSDREEPEPLGVRGANHPEGPRGVKRYAESSGVNKRNNHQKFQIE